LDRQYGSIHVIHHCNGARNGIFPIKKISHWPRTKTRCRARQQIIHGREPPRATLISDYIAQGASDNACLYRPVRMQCKLIREKIGLGVPRAGGAEAADVRARGVGDQPLQFVFSGGGDMAEQVERLFD